MSNKIKIIGIDPGLRFTGWGLIEKDGSHIRYIDEGTIKSNQKENLSQRLTTLHIGLKQVIEKYKPKEAAVEETFVSKNPNSTLKLGQARGIAILTPAIFEIPVFEYTPNAIKKAVVGVGHAKKDQILTMVNVLLRKVKGDSEHSIDALAIAICHSNSKNLNY
jgi:crossover junction endodeoxyribonuclease RuvC